MIKSDPYADLKDNLNHGNVVAFVGAGLSMDAGLPGWYPLLGELAGRIDYKLPPVEWATGDTLIEAAQAYINARGLFGLISFLKERLDTTGKPPAAAHQVLARLPIPLIVTANYDDLLERTYRAARKRVHVVVRDADIPFMLSGPDTVNIIKLYGDLNQPDTIVLARQQYEAFFLQRPQMIKLLETELGRSDALYLGWSHTDPHFNLIFGELLNRFGQFMRPGYAVMVDLPDPQRKEMERKRIQVIELAAGGDRTQQLANWLNNLTSPALKIPDRKKEAEPLVPPRSNPPNEVKIDYITYHVEVTSAGQSVHVTARHPDGTEAGQPRGPFGLAQVKAEVLALVDKAAGETASRRELERLGELLFGALFYDPAVSEHFRSAYRQARERKQGLRLELDFDETQLPEVAALPWEFIRAPQTPGYPGVTLATEPNLVLSRRRNLWEPVRRGAKRGAWRILLAVAAPDDLAPIAYEEVWQALQTLTQQPGAGFAPLGEPLLAADPMTLDTALGQEPDILHFIGHGRFITDPADPHGELAMVGAGGWAEWLRDEDFSSLLERHVPSLIFLHVSEGGALSNARGLTGLAAKVVQRNTPVVVALQYPISNPAALLFARKFYERLAAGDPVDKAAQEGRRALWYNYLGKREFATPVLFMRTPDGRLFADPSGTV